MANCMLKVHRFEGSKVLYRVYDTLNLSEYVRVLRSLSTLSTLSTLRTLSTLSMGKHVNGKPQTL